MTIKVIINNAVKRLKLEGKLLTPDFYAEAFCKEAKKAGMNVTDCNHLDKYTKSLNPEFQKDLKNYNIKTQNEFVRFIVSKLNRTNPTHAIKKDLEAHGLDPVTNFKVAHKKLYTIAVAVALEQNTQLLSQDLKSHSGEVDALSKKVRKLEKELEIVKQESKEDFLTKLYNRRALDDLMEIKEAEFKRYERNFSVVIFDLDKFKDVNDTYGHDAGDVVLVAFAKILEKVCRIVDVVGRFGGEEFMAILSDTDTKGGVIFAEKVRKHVQKACFMYQRKCITITVSSGVAEREKHISLSATANSADEYLYVAKANGRNRVEFKKK